MNTEHQIIQQTVDAFYAKARADILIGYHFARIADFSTHLPRIVAFWELQLLNSTNYQFVPALDALRVHIPLRFHRGEIDRWVKLFQETLMEQTMPTEFRERWQEKLRHFQQVFQNSPLLFSSQD